LKEKAVQLPDGLFVCSCRFAPHPQRTFFTQVWLALVAAGSPRGRARP